MPWQQVKPMEERTRFVLCAQEPGANISELCRQFGISRKTGYKLLSRYELDGLSGIEPKSRRPLHCPDAVCADLVCEIVSIRNAHPRWGGLTIQSILQRSCTSEKIPSARTIDRILDRCGMVEPRRRRSGRKYHPEKVIRPSATNDVWTVDFKGWWRTKDGKRCVPLTIRDEYSRYVLEIAALSEGTTEAVKSRFISCFEQYGLPRYIRSDNGSPFCAYLGLKGLSGLSVWWIKNGILPNRIPPGSPQHNGAHERLHRDIKAEIQNNPAKNLKTQQRIFDQWREEFNTIRPHRALQMDTPSSRYRVSERTYRSKLERFQYDDGFENRKVTSRGMVWWKGSEHFVSGALSRETIGLRKENEHTLSLWFQDFFLGNTDVDFSHPLGGDSV